jgi:poly-gamma-glutamate capsule biosynthesis protein CapA/YwtB (metallophosphatase superfamily)
MKDKKHIFKYTFIVLSIMCCLLIIVTYIMNDNKNISSKIYYSAPNGLVNSDATNKASSPTAQTNLLVDTPTAASISEISSTNLSEETTTDDNINKQPQEAQPHLEKIAIAPSVTISAVGDIMVHQSNLNNAYNPKTRTYNFSGFLEFVSPYLSKSDLTIGNFETVTAGSSSGYTSFPKFNTPDAIMPALANAGFDVLTTANNHCLDRGINGLTRTIKKITENKMVNVGSSVDGKNKYITKEINGIKISILSYSYSFNGNDANLTSKQKSTYLSPINEAQIKKDIEAVKSQGTDAVIVAIHWGTEYQRTPNTSQTSLSKKMLTWGADIILGSHPHVVQKSEIVKINGKDKFVIYSMGNFISGYRRSDTANRPNKVYTEDGVIVQLKLEKDSQGGVILKNADYIPTWVDKTYVNNRPVFKIIPIPDADAKEPYITNKNKQFVKQSYKNTMSIMAKFK